MAAALVGSLAHGEGDKWSDIDLALGVSETAVLQDVIDDWTEMLASEYGAVHLLDITSRGILYRVFLLPAGLQIDLSFTPAPEVWQGGPRFRLLFGSHRPVTTDPPNPREVLAWGTLYAIHVRACIGRKKYWQAHSSLSALLDKSMTLACVRLNLATGFGRGFDDLPDDVLIQCSEALVDHLDPAELTRAFRAAVVCLLHEAKQIHELGSKVTPHLESLLIDDQ